MEKDFSKWQKLKPIVDTNSKAPFFHEREIWWGALGVNIGVEQDGKNEGFERPILIVRKFNNRMFWGVPLTSKIRNDSYHYSFRNSAGTQCVILSQLRLLDGKRLYRKAGIITQTHLKKFVDKLENLYKRNRAFLRGFSEAKAVVPRV